MLNHPLNRVLNHPLNRVLNPAQPAARPVAFDERNTMTASTRTPKLSPDRAARFIDRALALGGLDRLTAGEASDLLADIDSGATVRGLAGEIQALIDAGSRRAVLARARAQSGREKRRAEGAMDAVAAFAISLGLDDAAEAAPAVDPEPEIVPETVPDLVSAPEPVSAAWGVA